LYVSGGKEIGIRIRIKIRSRIRIRNQPAGSAGCASLAEKPDEKGWRKLDGSQACQVHPGLTEQDAVRARWPSKKCQTKPIEIIHKSLALRELTSDGFGIFYAKQTQFRAVEASTLTGWRCREPALRQAPPLRVGQFKMPGNATERGTVGCRRMPPEWARGRGRG